MVKKSEKKSKNVLAQLKSLEERTEPHEPANVEVVSQKLFGLHEPLPQNTPAIYDHMTMDGTCVTEISLMQNENYAPEIIHRIMRPDHVSTLLAIKNSGDVPAFLSEGKQYIIDICREIDSLKVHTSMFIVLAMMLVGRILNEIHQALGNDRSKYARWVKENFGGKHTRYFQQCRQLVAMGEFATRYSSLGKNRLLQVDRLDDKESYKEIIEQHPYPDITEDRNGLAFNEHTDAAVTLYNLRQGGIDFADFEQAYLLSCFNKHWIAQKTVKKIKDWLGRFPAPEEKENAFEDYILNKMVLPSDREYQVVGNIQSLNTILSNLIAYYETHIQQGQTDWIEGVNKDTFELARNVMSTLAQVNIPERTEPSAMEKPSAALPIKEKKKIPARSIKTKKKGIKE